MDFTHYVYFLTDKKHYKIGYTWNIKVRLPAIALKRKKKLKLIGFFTFPNQWEAYDFEQKIHKKLRKIYKVRGEWYPAELTVFDFVAGKKGFNKCN